MKLVSILKNTLLAVTGILVWILNYLTFTLILTVVLGYFIWLLFENLTGPSTLAIILDILTVAGMVFLIRSKSWRKGFSDFVNQVKRNM